MACVRGHEAVQASHDGPRHSHGRKTYESIGKPLPNRTSIVISRGDPVVVQGDVTANSPTLVVRSSLTDALDTAYKVDSDPFVIGGGEIYRSHSLS